MNAGKPLNIAQPKTTMCKRGHLHTRAKDRSYSRLPGFLLREQPEVSVKAWIGRFCSTLPRIESVITVVKRLDKAGAGTSPNWPAHGKTEFSDPGCSGCQIERGLCHRETGSHANISESALLMVTVFSVDMCSEQTTTTSVHSGT